MGWREIWTLLQVSERFGFRRALWDWERQKEERRGEDGNSTLLGWSTDRSVRFFLLKWLGSIGWFIGDCSLLLATRDGPILCGVVTRGRCAAV